MAGTAKRTRQQDENPASTSSCPPPSGPSSSTPTRQTSSGATPTPTPPRTRASSVSRRPATRNHPSSGSSSPSILTRSTNSALSLSSSTLSSARGGNLAHESSFGGPRPFPAGPSTRSAGPSMLQRTQSTPVISSPSQIKSAAGSGAPEQPPKGDSDGLGLGGRRFGKGKENIPPKRDEERQAEPAKKRMRVTSRGSYNGGRRQRSGSVTSVRSETTSSGRHSSLAPSLSSSSLGSWGGRFSSPAPSVASSSSFSLDAVGPLDRLSVLDNEDGTTNSSGVKHRPITRSIATMLPTPPPSTPPEDEDVILDPGDVSDTETEKAPNNPYKQLKASLRYSSIIGASVDDTIIGRQQEKLVLRDYLGKASDEDVGMYVSGPPGTGKTALVTALGREMAGEGWKLVELLCMGMRPQDVWRTIGTELECGRTEKEVKEFVSREDTKVMIILDEVDSLMPPPPATAPPSVSHLLAKLFSLPLKSPFTKLVAISNTLDLTTRANLVLPDNLQPTVLPFKAYGQLDMSAIVNARLASAGVEAVKADTTAITLLGKKVEAQNGDLRMCLGVLISGISLAESEWIKKISTAAKDPEPKPVTMPKVGVSHVMKALTSYASRLRAAAGSSAGASSAAGKKIKSVGLQGKMVLVAILVWMVRVKAGLNGCPSVSGSGSSTPCSDISASALYTAYSHILSHHSSPFPPAPESDYRDLLSNLEVLGLIALVSPSSSTRSSSHSGNRISLIMKEEEIKEGLGLGEGTAAKSAVGEEEVRRVWEREESKVRRIRDKMAMAASAEED
ncbi:hypothetical protein I350_03523 [Cryptococcus amylolentus CBS 6273]|uniref:AAA+ ATPase domain-containing protein n=1 Tax=Cryptococcus amylolentus CBS 6273 TaxID=1296118 RepID=A0A1E3K4C7_9TREE|nr:hypothetical protein I350_03523 [Cryptococcus amylolentus CBS 6273]